ncbi:adenylate cyclase [Pseudomonas nitritireducens]|uniref:Adenylate cyclase n=1 Tax=Pseudomonas nitroreducens TaxID=46680 RepID=A0A7W7KRD4_PSENT|nr:CYTH domain-containing protein [Pseudomonas nitritireducens]MBB4867580.1 adenylate cyclase [Pseudomonas nitritireducens]
MKSEIERKYRVTEAFRLELEEMVKNPLCNMKRISQVYLSDDPAFTARIRRSGSDGVFTVKGLGDAEGVERPELETDLPLEFVESVVQLAQQAGRQPVDKIRVLIPWKEHTFEVDLFQGDNYPLVMAEIEFSDRNNANLDEKPTWLGDEVTGQAKYYNSYLAKRPYSTWGVQGWFRWKLRKLIALLKR